MNVINFYAEMKKRGIPVGMAVGFIYQSPIPESQYVIVPKKIITIPKIKEVKKYEKSI